MDVLWNAVAKIDDVILGFIWLILALSSLLVALFPCLNFVAHHGKLSNVPAVGFHGRGAQIVREREGSAAVEEKRRPWMWVSQVTVPKKWFAHLYITGLAFGILALFYPTLTSASTTTTTYTSCSFLSALRLTLFLLHCTRRLCESLFLSDFGESRMHISGYLVGILHYVLAPVTLYCSGNSSGSDTSKTEWSFAVAVAVGMVVVLFIVSNYLQFSCHRTLSHGKGKGIGTDKEEKIENTITLVTSLKSNPRNKQYSFPTGGLFEYVCCPHYFAEICIYVCFVALVWLQPERAVLCAVHDQTCSSTSTSTYTSFGVLCMLGWVTCNLCVVANENLLWYKQQFPNEVAVRAKSKVAQWKRCIPFIY